MIKKRTVYVYAMRLLLNGLDCFFFHNCNLTSIISTCWAYCVIYIEFTTIWTNCQCWSYGSVMSSSFTSSCF